MNNLALAILVLGLIGVFIFKKINKKEIFL